MLILNWYREWLEIRREIKQENRVCQSCETLKEQLNISNHEKAQLLSRLLEKPEPIPERTTAPPPQAVRPTAIPWKVRQQLLETEDRKKAQLLKNAPKPDAPVAEVKVADIEELEKEMDIASAEREAAQ